MIFFLSLRNWEIVVLFLHFITVNVCPIAIIMCLYCKWLTAAQGYVFVLAVPPSQSSQLTNSASVKTSALSFPISLRPFRHPALCSSLPSCLSLTHSPSLYRPFTLTLSLSPFRFSFHLLLSIPSLWP